MTRKQAVEAARRFVPGWVAMDSDGSWWWFDAEPHKHNGAWYADGAIHELNADSVNWRESLEKVGE